MVDIERAIKGDKEAFSRQLRLIYSKNTRTSKIK